MRHKHKMYPLRIPLEHREKISYIAGEHDGSFNSEVRLLIEEHIKSYEEINGEISKADIEEFEKNKNIK